MARFQPPRHGVRVVLEHDDTLERIEWVNTNQRAFDEAGRTGKGGHSF